MDFAVYKDLNEDYIIGRLKLNTNKDRVENYQSILGELIQEAYRLKLGGDIFKSYICYMLANSENPLSLAAEQKHAEIEEGLKSIAIRDLEMIIEIFNSNIFDIEYSYETDKPYNILYQKLNDGIMAEEFVDVLIEYYKAYGCGKMSMYKAFKWDRTSGMIGICECDPIRLDNLLGCEYQKNALIKNTENFLLGKPANNALLFGDSGTGKSSMVKALINEYSPKGLRVIEVSKSDFVDFNKIVANIRGRGLKYIIFLDDLSFEEFETEYKYMKALIEGGIEIKPNNVIIYATSNRRHLIRETWDERQGQDVNVNDTRQEKLSLSDRFGLSLTFTSPMQNGYLEIVMNLAKQYNVKMDENSLREKAIQWELSHGGRSGRVAKQFILSLL